VVKIRFDLAPYSPRIDEVKLFFDIICWGVIIACLIIHKFKIQIKPMSDTDKLEKLIMVGLIIH
jgi:hypothetical protein